MTEQSLRQTILDILEKEWPLTAKQIYYTIKKQSSRQITYQAVFKCVKNLTKEGELIRDKKTYKLNIDWLYKLKQSAERRIKQYMLKELQLGLEGNIPIELHIEVLNFVKYVGPNAEKYLGNDKGTIVITSGGAHIFGLALSTYLTKHNKRVNRIVIDRFLGTGIIKESVYGRKLIVVDSGTHTGKTYRAVMDMLNKVKKPYRIKGIRYAVYFDRAGIADWSCPRAYNAIEYMI